MNRRNYTLLRGSHHASYRVRDLFDQPTHLDGIDFSNDRALIRKFYFRQNMDR